MGDTRIATDTYTADAHSLVPSLGDHAIASVFTCYLFLFDSRDLKTGKLLSPLFTNSLTNTFDKSGHLVSDIKTRFKTHQVQNIRTL